MRPIVIVLIVLALGTALIAAYLVSQFLASQTAPVQTATTTQAGTINVLVAAHDIAPGAVLADGDMNWEPWPKNLVGDRFVTQPEQAVEGQPDPKLEFVDHIARRTVMTGEPMSKEMVIKQGDSSVTAANLAPGKRAITITVTPSTGVAGLILPNDHVDVVMSSSVRDLAGLQGWNDVVARYTAETVMKDLRVVAINQKLSHDPKEGVAEAGSLVTLEVSPEQAEKLLVTAQVGSLSLILRSMVPGKTDNMQQTFTMDVRGSRALSSLVALSLNEDEADMPATMGEAMVMAKERAKMRIEVKINRGGAVALQKFGN